MFCRRVVNKSCFRINSLQKSFSTNQVDLTEPTKKLHRQKQNYQYSTELYEQLKGTDVEYFIDKIPKKLLRKVNTLPKSLLLINCETAKSVASMISENLIKNSSFVIESNPGLGLLTKELLDRGVPSIHLYEKRLTFFTPGSPLLKLLSKHPEQLHIKQLDFFDIWMMLIRDQFHNEDLSAAYMVDFPSSDWESDTNAQIIAICPNRNFLSLLMHNFFRLTTIFQLGRPSFYLILPSSSWMRMIAKNQELSTAQYYSHHNVMLQLFFDYKILGEVPRQSFIPWLQSKCKSIDTFNDPMLVVLLEPKRDAFSIMEKKDIRPFWFFLKHMMRTRKHRVIKEFEKLVPGCGPKLIQKDMHICTTFKELEPDKLAELFKMFKTWPEYDETLYNPTLLINEEDKKSDDIEPDEEELNEETEAEVGSQDLSVDSLNTLKKEEEKT